VHGPALALAVIEDLELDDYHLYHATRAELLSRLDRRADARAAYDRAYDLATNAAEKAFLDEKRRAL
jgi:predicted RNA polymerase sigma factor